MALKAAKISGMSCRSVADPASEMRPEVSNVLGKLRVIPSLKLEARN